MLAPFSEARAWWDEAVSRAPGQIGAALRRRALQTRTTGGAARVLAEPGLVVRGWRNVEIGPDVRFGRGVRLDASAGTISLGARTALNAGVSIGADFGAVSFGEAVIVGMNVVVRAANHRFDRSPDVLIIDQGHEGGEVTVGDDVWIGAGAVLLAGTDIASHCVIGAGSVVNGPIPSGSVAVGSPARVVREL